MNTTTPTHSYRERIAAAKTRVAQPLAAALALSAIAPVAEAAVYTVAEPAANNLQFDPLDGSTSPGNFVVSPENPLFFGACGGAFIVTESALHSGGNFFYVAPSTPEWAKVATLDAGVTIDGSSIYYDPGQFEYSQTPAAYDESTPRYVGFRYTNQGVGGNETYFGWIEFFMPDENTAVVTRFAIGGDGQAIVTGSDVSAIPEPGSAALLVGALALGAVGTRRRRR